MVASALAVGEAVGTYQNFYLSTVFLGYLFQRLKIVVPVVVKYNKAVVLFQFLDERPRPLICLQVEEVSL